MQRELAAVSAETAPSRSLLASIDSTSTKPSIYAGETSTARPALTGDKGRYTQSDPVGLGNVNVLSYGIGNPLRYSDPLGLYSIDNRINTKPSSGVAQSCGSPFACSLVSATVYCQCHCDMSIGHFVADATLLLSGTIYYFNGPFGSIKKKTTDPTVKDVASAIAHEYNYHINFAIDAVIPLLQALESKGFTSDTECQAECKAVAKKLNPLFDDTLQATQKQENQQ